MELWLEWKKTKQGNVPLTLSNCSFSENIFSGALTLDWVKLKNPTGFPPVQSDQSVVFWSISNSRRVYIWDHSCTDPFQQEIHHIGEDTISRVLSGGLRCSWAISVTRSHNCCNVVRQVQRNAITSHIIKPWTTDWLINGFSLAPYAWI